MPRRHPAPFTFVAAVTLVACGDAAPPPVPAPTEPPAANAPDDAEAERRFLAEIDRSRGVRDCFLPIRDPAFVGADGPHGLADGEFVVGTDLTVAGAAVQFAYPVQYLNFHEIVEHTVESGTGPLHLLACW